MKGYYDGSAPDMQVWAGKRVFTVFTRVRIDAPSGNRQNERMQGILWNERFSVGVQAMDAQHKRLIDLINALRGSDDMGIAFDTIMGMFDYASVHFRDEEQLLRKAGYSELDTQVREHKAFLDQAVAFSKKDLSDPRIGDEIIRYLRSWLLQHILNEDMKYKRCIPPHLQNG